MISVNEHLRTDLRIYQIFYHPRQSLSLDPDFIPYCNQNPEDGGRFEFDVFKREFLAGKIDKGLTGYVSWKFGAKTGLSGRRFRSFILDNPGYEVYFVNPFPEQMIWRSVWHQAQKYHPQLPFLAQSIVSRAWPGLDLMDILNNFDTLAYGNYWVGSEKFWRSYMEFVLPVDRVIRNELTLAERGVLESRADRLIDADHRPFLFERMFSTFLVNFEVRALPYRYSNRELERRYGGAAGRLLFELQEEQDLGRVSILRERLVESLRIEDPIRDLRERFKRSALGQWLYAAIRRDRR